MPLSRHGNPAFHQRTSMPCILQLIRQVLPQPATASPAPSASLSSSSAPSSAPASSSSLNHLLAKMQQQLRAGIAPTLPTSEEARTALAHSILPNSTPGSDLPRTTSDVAIPRVEALSRTAGHRGGVIMEPSHGNGIDDDDDDVNDASTHNDGDTVSRKRGRTPATGSSFGTVVRGVNGDALAEGSASRDLPGGLRSRMQRVEPRWTVIREWAFNENQHGKWAVKRPAFFSELWMMMASFGEGLSSPESSLLSPPFVRRVSFCSRQSTSTESICFHAPAGNYVSRCLPYH